MTQLSIELTDEMKRFAEQEATACGYKSVGEYLDAVLRERERERQAGELETELLKGLEGKPVEMTKDDWSAIRNEAKERRELNRHG